MIYYEMTAKQFSIEMDRINPEFNELLIKLDGITADFFEVAEIMGGEKVRADIIMIWDRYYIGKDKDPTLTKKYFRRMLFDYLVENTDKHEEWNAKMKMYLL